MSVVQDGRAGCLLNHPGARRRKENSSRPTRNSALKKNVFFSTGLTKEWYSEVLLLRLFRRRAFFVNFRILV